MLLLIQLRRWHFRSLTSVLFGILHALFSAKCYPASHAPSCICSVLYTWLPEDFVFTLLPLFLIRRIFLENAYIILSFGPILHYSCCFSLPGVICEFNACSPCKYANYLKENTNQNYSQTLNFSWYIFSFNKESSAMLFGASQEQNKLYSSELFPWIRYSTEFASAASRGMEVLCCL